MPKRIEWTKDQDETIISMRADGKSYDAIATVLGYSRWGIICRGVQLGLVKVRTASPPMPTIDLEFTELIANDRSPLPPGHDISWKPINKGTCLEDIPYPLPVFDLYLFMRNRLVRGNQMDLST